MSRILEPVIYGDYPSSMKEIVGSRLPSFTEQQSEKLKGSSDFIGLIHYTTTYVLDSPSYRDLSPRDFTKDSLATYSGMYLGLTSQKVCNSQNLFDGLHYKPIKYIKLYIKIHHN